MMKILNNASSFLLFNKCLLIPYLEQIKEKHIPSLPLFFYLILVNNIFLRVYLFTIKNAYSIT
jgi:hypothetical protein